jgi:hypothetical protein
MEQFRRAQEPGFKREQARETGLLCPACGMENMAGGTSYGVSAM